MPTAEPVPENIYHIRCDKATYKRSGPNSKNPGTGMAEVQFTIFGPEELEEFHGRKVFDNLMLGGEGMFRTRMFLEAAGQDEEFVLDDTDLLLNLECGAVVEVEPEREDPDNPGKKFGARNRIVKYIPIE
jgi:hypothetical protein